MDRMTIVMINNDDVYPHECFIFTCCINFLEDSYRYIMSKLVW